MSTLFYITIAIFVVTYAIIISEKVHRTVIAMTGAMLMILLGIINQEQAVEGIDFNTLGLLIGMMIIVGIAKECGMFQYVAIWASKVGKGKPLPIFVLLGIITAVFSAFLDNVTTVLLMVPVTFVIANNLKLDAKPYLIGAILLSNIGGAATLIGDPPNILIGSAAGLTFMDFIINMMPVAIVSFLAVLGLLVLFYRKAFIPNLQAQKDIMKFDPMQAITDKPLLIKSLIVLAIVFVGFFTHNMTHIEGATIALSGAALLLLLTMYDPENHLKEIEWTTIFFFIGLFILVAALEHMGVIRIMAEYLLTLTGGDATITTITVLWGSAVFSAIVDNIPFVATMIPLIKDIGAIAGIPLTPLWWALALGADFGGNATIIGASANVVVCGMSEKHGYRITFLSYMKVALPMTAVSLVIATVYLYIFYL